MSALLVTLPAPSASQGEYAYAQISSTGHVQAYGQAAPKLLPQADEVTLVAPAQALSWHRLPLPKLGAGAMRASGRAVLEGLLEELVLEDPAGLHFALGAHAAAGQPQWVCVCGKAWLQGHVQALRAAGLRLTRIAPQAFALQEGQAVQLHVSGSADAPLAVLADAQGVLCVPLSALAALGLTRAAGAVLSSSAGAEAVQGSDLQLSAEPAVAAQAEQALHQAPAILTAHQHAAQRAAAAKAVGWDLAQFELALSGPQVWRREAQALWQDLWRAPQWRAARWGLAALVAAQLVGLNAWAWHERKALEAKRAQVNQVFAQSFPKVKVVLDAPLQMRREAAALRQAAGQLSPGDLENLLGQFAIGFGPLLERQTSPSASAGSAATGNAKAAEPMPQASSTQAGPKSSQPLEQAETASSKQASASGQGPLAIEFSDGQVSVSLPGVTREMLASANARMRGVQVRLDGARLLLASTPGIGDKP